MIEQTDVLVIGGGPAGLATGIAMASQGIRTLVYERKDFPVGKVCGEGLMPTGLAFLERLGVTRFIRPEHSHYFSGIRYISPQGRRLQSDFAQGPGMGIRREVLSAALQCRAKELPRLEVRTGYNACPLARTEAGILVEAGGKEILARLLVGADGLNSGVRAWAGLQGPRPDIWRWGARQHFQIRPWNENVEVYWEPGIEAYVTPCAPDLVGVAFLWEPKAFGKADGGARLIPGLLQNFPELEDRLRRARSFDEACAVGPLQRKSREPLADRVMLVGDAAGYLDAITGEGLSLAFEQAVAAAGIACRLFEDAWPKPPQFTRAELQSYADAYRNSVRSYYFFTRLALFFSRQPSWLEIVIPLLQRQPFLFKTLLSANMGRFPS